MPLLDPKHRLEFPGLKGVYGAVTVEGEALEVYGVKTVGNKKMAYVEAREGKEFEVVLREERTSVEESYLARTFIDGTKIHGAVVSKTRRCFASSRDSEARSTAVSGRKTAATVLQPFTFAPLQTTDDDAAACTTEAVIKGMGSLVIEYRRIKTIRSSLLADTYSGNAAQPIHEQSKKAADSHQTQFGEARTVATKGISICDEIDKEPLATVEFRYRSRALLQLEGLIPDDPVASPAASPSASTRPSPAAVAQSPSPAVAGPSQPRPRPRTRSASPRPPPPPATNATLNMDDDELEAELLALKTQQRIAELEKEKRRRSQGGSSQASQSQARKVKAEPGSVGERERKLEEGEKVEREKEEGRKKGKQAEVLDLCDSD